MELKDLKQEDRLRLMGFVCSFAWADLEIADGERELVADLVKKLDLDEDEKAQVDQRKTRIVLYVGGSVHAIHLAW